MSHSGDAERIRGITMSKVLVVEDDALVASTIELMLAKAGYEVVIAKDGFEALAIFDHVRPDAILPDMMLPSVVGLEVIEAVRSRAPGLPIIAMSGSGRTQMYDVLRNALQAGANAVIRKPFEKRELLRLLPSPVAGRAPGVKRWSDFDFGLPGCRSALSAVLRSDPPLHCETFPMASDTVLAAVRAEMAVP